MRRQLTTALVRLGGDAQGVIHQEVRTMNSIIYIVGLVVVIVAVLSFFGLR
ncbi:hypothetical protein [Pseudorhodoferax sp. Leaf267]|uniref:hypothetical protein n=1 Tax=Pseudorhodoferax sp. Leaf267 TaxID=1736316 RepID=UPI0012E1AFD8|nr:hypothetical protein [Pseudorhodoferax sp. Leaf267]